LGSSLAPLGGSVVQALIGRSPPRRWRLVLEAYVLLNVLLREPSFCLKKHKFSFRTAHIGEKKIEVRRSEPVHKLRRAEHTGRGGEGEGGKEGGKEGGTSRGRGRHPCPMGQGHGPSIAHDGALVRATRGGGRRPCPQLDCPFRWPGARAIQHLVVVWERG